MTTTTTKATAQRLLEDFRDRATRADDELVGIHTSIQKAGAAGKAAQTIEGLVQQLHAAELELQLLTNLVSIAEWGIESERSDADIRATLKDQMLQALTNGADDTWSGRNNDLRRAGHDAVRRLIHQLLYAL